MILPVPVKPWVKFLLEQQYSKKNKPIPIRADSDIGNILMLARSEADGGRIALHELTNENNPFVEDELEHNLEIVRFEVEGLFREGVFLVDTIPAISRALDSYFRIFAKAFSAGYRSFLNSERASAIAFMNLYGLKEGVIKQDTMIKMVQRENAKMRNPFVGEVRGKKRRQRW